MLYQQSLHLIIAKLLTPDIISLLCGRAHLLMAKEGEQVDFVTRILACFTVDTRCGADISDSGIVIFVEDASCPHTIPMLGLHAHETIHLALSIDEARETRKE